METKSGCEQWPIKLAQNVYFRKGTVFRNGKYKEEPSKILKTEKIIEVKSSVDVSEAEWRGQLQKTTNKENNLKATRER